MHLKYITQGSGARVGLKRDLRRGIKGRIKMLKGAVQKASRFL